MPQIEPSQQKLFNCLRDLGVIALQSEMQEIERIVIESEAGQLAKQEAIQSYLLGHGTNDEKVNDEILILKGLKERSKS